MLSPDAAYISPRRLAERPAATKKGFPQLCPDFAIELLSQSDRLGATKQKMEDWIDNGVLLGWLFDPYRRAVYVYEPDLPPVTAIADSIQGTGPVAGFRLDLAEVWRCYE